MKKLLFISKNFPPAALGGVKRPIKFAKYLKEYGWEPVVLTDNPKKIIVDEYFMQEVINSKIKVERTGDKKYDINKAVTNVTNPKFVKTKKLLTSLTYIPDKEIKWKNRAYKKALELWNKYNGFDLIYSTSPPYTNLLVAQMLKQKFRVPLVVDYREAWVDSPINYYPTFYHLFRNEKLERNLLRDADKVITTNRRMKEIIISHYDRNSYNDVRIFPNGFDEDDIKFVSGKNLPYSTKMRFTYTGSLNSKGLKIFFKSIKMLFSKHPELVDEIEFCYIGLMPKSLYKTAKDLGIIDSLYFPGFLNYSECLKYLLASDVLFLHIKKGKNDDALMPGILGDYIVSRKNILGIIPEGVTQKVLTQYKASKIVLDYSPEIISDAMFDYWKLYYNDNLPEPDEKLINQFEVKQYVEELAKEFNYLMDLE